MELILNGKFDPNYQEKTVEINGTPMKHMLAVLHTADGAYPITIWGDRKADFAKKAIATGQDVKIIVLLIAKSASYTNQDGETVRVPNLQLKLYSFVGFWKNNASANAPISTPPPFYAPTNNQYDETPGLEGII